MQDFQLEINGIQAIACAEKAIFLPEAGSLIVSDFHFGKASHFRKSGIAVPVHPEEENLHRLDRLVQRLSPAQIVFAGDMFHSRANQSLRRFEAWRKTLPHIEVLLVAGNHDIMSAHTYKELGIERVENEWSNGPLSICHDPKDARPEAGRYYLAGHVHPGYKLMGPGGEAIMLPCLLLGQEVGLMPAFGSFTGLSQVWPKDGERVLLFGEGRLYELPVPRLKV